MNKAENISTTILDKEKLKLNKRYFGILEKNRKVGINDEFHEKFSGCVPKSIPVV